MTTKNQIAVSDEELGKEIDSLNKKTDKTEDESQKLDELKQERHSRYQARIDKEVSARKALEYEKEQEKKRAEELERRLAQIEEEKKKTITPSVKRETVEIGGKKFYTDDALVSMVQAGDITDAEAYRHQRERERAEDRDIIVRDYEQKKAADEQKKIQAEDVALVLSKHPEFDPKHPEFDPNNKLYKLASRLWAEGYASNPRGMSLAISVAEEMLGTNIRPDVTDDLSVTPNSAPASKKKSADVALTKEEEDIAVSMYTRGDVVNPTTGRPYTEAEALAKAKSAKARKLS